MNEIGPATDQRRLVEVFADGLWQWGEVLQWTQHKHGRWTALVSWSEGPMGSTRLETFDPGRINLRPKRP